jgi:hypothetical protein
LPSAIVALTGAWISGCSVLYDLKTEQCSTDADCDALGGTFTGLACVEHLCQTPPGCNSHGECIDTFGSGGEAWACIARECIKMQTAECPSLLPAKNEGWLEALRGDDPVIMAGTGVITTAGTLDPRLRNYELALAELNGSTGGLQGTRKLMMLGCKANATEAEIDSIMTHLNRLRVHSMVTAFYAENLQYALQTYGIPASMFFMSPLESDPQLATIGDSGLLWHIGPSPDVIGRAYAPLLTRVLAHLGLTENVRVATVVAEDQRFMTSMMTSVTQGDFGIRFNNGSVADNLGTNYLGLTVTAGEMESNEEVASLLQFKPHVIISAAAPEFFNNIIAGVEAGWNVTDGQPKPFYILSPFNYNDVDSLRAVTAGNPTLRTRLAGVNGAGGADPTNYNNYLVAYQDYFQLSEPGYENFYDAAYYAMYAAGAVSATSALEGPDFTRGMRRLLGGSQAFDVGRADLPAGLAAVANGASIQLNGTLGPPDWKENGTRELPGSVYCIDSGDNFVGDVLRYNEATPGDASSVTLEGNFSCFDFGPPPP